MKIDSFFGCCLLFFASMALAQNMTDDNSNMVYAMGVTIADDMKKAGLEKFDKTCLSRRSMSTWQVKVPWTSQQQKALLTNLKRI